MDNILDAEIMENYEVFMTKFPPNTKVISITGSLKEYEAELRCPCKNKQEFISWLRQLEDLSKITFRVAVTRPRVGKSVLFKAVYRCQHNTYPNSHQRVKTPHKKHTACPAQLRVTIKSSEIKRRVRSSDVLRFEYPTLVTVIHRHNHNILVAEELKFKDMSEDVKLKLIDMFKSHHPPSRALEILKEDLLEEYGDEYYKVSADTSICPTIQAVYNFYYSVFKKEFGEEKTCIGDYLVELLKRSDPQTKVKYELLNQNEFVLAAVPSLMARVHNLKHSAETVFIDSSGNMDRYNCKVFLLLTDSPVGGLPLGFLMTSLETEEGIFKALTLLKEILPSKRFGGRIIKEPQVFMTDDCQAQINAIARVFPSSKIYLCTFHILQSLWRWLLQSSHKIDVKDRQYLFTLFKHTLYSVNEEQFHINCNLLLQDSVALKYTNFVKHIQTIFQSAVMWSHCYRQNNRNINTNNTVENAMKIMKDKVLNRTRAYNPIQLYKFIEIDLCNYYSRKIADIISGKYNGHQHLRHFPKQNKMQDLIVLFDEYGLYTVKNKTLNTEYTVNLELGICSCPVGKNGAPCKHQHVVALQTNKPCDNIIPITTKQRAYYHWIAFGTNVAEDWYDSLSSVNANKIVPSVCENNKNETTNMESLEAISDPIINFNHEEPEPSFAPDWNLLQQRFNNLFDTWKGGSNPLEYYKGLEKTVSFFENCKTETAAISALHCVGKQFKARKYATKIPVQPTAISRRKIQCGGRTCVQSGRPLKKSYIDHSYSKKKGGRKQKRPHALQCNIDLNNNN